MGRWVGGWGVGWGEWGGGRVCVRARSPSINMAVTIRFVMSAKPQKTRCVRLPNLALITCRKVLAPGARICKKI